MAVEDASEIAVFVPFKYDLGGSITDIERLPARLRALHGEAHVDRALVRSWNLSYLSSHAPIVWCELPRGETELSGHVWRYSRKLRVYPWLGVVSIDYMFTPLAADVDLSTVYDDIVEWKNRDYVPYLKDCDALSDSLRRQLPGSEFDSVDLHGTSVRALRSAVRDIIEPRPVTYAFHDFRVCFLGTVETIRDDETSRLLWFTDLAAPNAVEQRHTSHFYDGVEVASSGWSTIIRTHPGECGRSSDAVLTLLNLIHAQWFVCQLWISTHALERSKGKTVGRTDAHVLAANQSALAQDLSEIDNLNVMLKDPGLLRLARYLEAAMEVRKHKETAMARLRVLENHSRQLTDYQSEQELRRFQALFAISAAAGVASLVPALAQVGFSYIHTVTTVIPLLGLWGLFAVDFQAVRRRRAARRARRRPLDPELEAADPAAQTEFAEE